MTQKRSFVPLAVAALALCHCNSGSSANHDATFHDGETPLTDGGLADSTATHDADLPPVTVVVSSDQTIAGHPHTIDYYIPSNATKAIVFLHGGGGSKEGFAYNLDIKSSNASSSYEVSTDGKSWLIDQKVAAIFPQGQKIGVLKPSTWSNYLMDSGVDDVGFLKDLVTSMKSNPSLSNVKKIYLVGHSNGGVMANRFWCESPTTFDGYGALAGPPAAELDPSGSAHPCNPAVAKPYIAIFGDHDSQLQTAGNMAANTWTVISYNADSNAWSTTNAGEVLNELVYYTDKRVNMTCGGSAAQPITSGQLTTYSDCANTLELIIVAQVGGDAGDHCLRTAVSTCITTLAGNTGLDYKTAVFDFLKQH